MKKFLKNFGNYYHYIIFSGKAALKAEVANSHLNWLWWILDPFLFMLVYSFVALVVYGKSEPYFPLFVFLGLNVWNFFSKTLTSSVKAVYANRNILSRIYVPKYVLILSIMYQNFFKLLITFGLVFVLMPFYKVGLTYQVLYLPLLFLLLALITFGASCILMHFGVYVSDLENLTRVGLRLAFYLSGIFYSIPKRVPRPYSGLLLTFNPLALIIDAVREAVLYGGDISFPLLGIWGCAGLLTIVAGVSLISKYENSYIKIVS